jgi:hypothetical protein
VKYASAAVKIVGETLEFGKSNHSPLGTARNYLPNSNFLAILLNRKAKKSGCAFVKPPRRFNESLLIYLPGYSQKASLFIYEILVGANAPFLFLGDAENAARY